MSVKVAQKIIEIMKKVDYLKKDGNVNFKTTNYNYLSEEKVTQAVSKARADVGLVILPVKVDTHRDGNITSVTVTYAIIDSESGEKMEVQMAGQGSDSQDKGIAKALTQAFKYIQRQSFGIPTGDDPDHISSSELDEQQKKQQQKNEVLQKQIENNYRKLNPSMDGFQEFIGGLLQKGNTLSQINDFLLKKIAERKNGGHTQQRGNNS